MSAFEQAAKRVLTLKASPNNQEKLALYGLYKQATVGDNKSAQPWAVQLEARAKWDAWNACKGKSKPDAERLYVNKVDELVKKYGVK